jgi:hypothetical protein
MNEIYYSCTQIQIILYKLLLHFLIVRWHKKQQEKKHPNHKVSNCITCMIYEMFYLSIDYTTTHFLPALHDGWNNRLNGNSCRK